MCEYSVVKCSLCDSVCLYIFVCGVSLVCLYLHDSHTLTMVSCLRMPGNRLRNSRDSGYLTLLARKWGSYVGVVSMVTLVCACMYSNLITSHIWFLYYSIYFILLFYKHFLSYKAGTIKRRWQNQGARGPSSYCHSIASLFSPYKCVLISYCALPPPPLQRALYAPVKQCTRFLCVMNTAINCEYFSLQDWDKHHLCDSLIHNKFNLLYQTNYIAKITSKININF